MKPFKLEIKEDGSYEANLPGKPGIAVSRGPGPFTEDSQDILMFATEFALRELAAGPQPPDPAVESESRIKQAIYILESIKHSPEGCIRTALEILRGPSKPVVVVGGSVKSPPGAGGSPLGGENQENKQ